MPDLQSPASAAAKTGAASPPWMRIGPGRGWGPVLERMPDERRRHVALAKKLFFEGKNDGEAAHGDEPADAPGRPGPHLWGDVVEHGDARRVGGRGCAQHRE